MDDRIHQALAVCVLLAIVAALCGCATKTRNIDMAGIYGSDRGAVAIGKVSIQAIPEGVDSSLIKYSEDNAWLSPTMKLHDIAITITGSNSVDHVSGVVKAICDAFKVKVSSGSEAK